MIQREPITLYQGPGGDDENDGMTWIRRILSDQRAHQLAESWIGAGFDVTILTGPDSADGIWRMNDD